MLNSFYAHLEFGSLYFLVCISVAETLIPEDQFGKCPI